MLEGLGISVLIGLYILPGYAMLKIDAFSGYLHRKYPPILVLVGWPLLFIKYFVMYIYKYWFTVHK